MNFLKVGPVFHSKHHSFPVAWERAAGESLLNALYIWVHLTDLANESDIDFYELLGKTKALGSTQPESRNSFLWGHLLRARASHPPPLLFNFLSPEGDVAQSRKPAAPLQPTPQKEKSPYNAHITHSKPQQKKVFLSFALRNTFRVLSTTGWLVNFLSLWTSVKVPIWGFWSDVHFLETQWAWR